MSATGGSLTKFLATAVLTLIVAELVGRALSTWFDVEPFYDQNSGWLHMVVVGPVVTWAFFRFKVIERLRERGHIQ
ncbi:hypothetical protein JW805_08240 [Roseomonas aeriglobus]|nr:hypothetical protein [Roseomonas aeriglobus]